LRNRIEIIGDAQLILGDCRELLPDLTFDALVSDPPYGIAHVKGAGGHGKHNRRNIAAIAGDAEPFDPAHLIGFKHVIIWGADHYAQRLPRGRWLIWDKLDGLPSFDSFSDVEVAWLNKPGASRIIHHLWKGICQASEKDGRREHPTQKPVSVMRWCLDQLPAEARVICDPYMGSGTTGVACAADGRPFIGIEIDPGYFDIACRRIAEAHAQPRLFEICEKPAAIPAPVLFSETEAPAMKKPRLALTAPAA
jgi:site-specific DNA-methyltransferase (adenine-specific)